MLAEAIAIAIKGSFSTSNFVSDACLVIRPSGQ